MRLKSSTRPFSSANCSSFEPFLAAVPFPLGNKRCIRRRDVCLYVHVQQQALSLELLCVPGDHIHVGRVIRITFLEGGPRVSGGESGSGGLLEWDPLPGSVAPVYDGDRITRCGRAQAPTCIGRQGNGNVGQANSCDIVAVGIGLWNENWIGRTQENWRQYTQDPLMEERSVIKKVTGVEKAVIVDPWNVGKSHAGLGERWC